MIETSITPIPGVLSIHLVHSVDQRGTFTKTFHRTRFEELGLATDFAETYFSSSIAGVVRGMHFQKPPMDHAKLLYCSAGRVLDVVLDLRKKSPAYGQYVAFELDGDAPRGIYIPRGCAHGFLSLTDGATLLYAVETVYDQTADSGVRWDGFGYNWPVTDPIISQRDREFPTLANFRSPFDYP